jgi:hypothetical protein
VHIRMRRSTLLLAGAAAAMAIVTAPGASAAPNGQSCLHAGGSTNCQGPGDVQVHASPRGLPRFFPPSINPRWRDVGYSAPFPDYGFKPKWQAFGYDPKYSGFQPRPSVLRPPQIPVAQVTQKPADMGGSTTYQTPDNAQITAQTGLAAQQATHAQYPSAAGTAPGTGDSAVYQTPGQSQIIVRPGPTARTAAGQAAFFPVSGLPSL